MIQASDFLVRIIAGGRPSRHSSPMDEVWVQRMGDMVKSPVTQMLHPIHSLMSSSRPSLILLGKNGSAIEGRAAPIRSKTPDWIWRTISSGEVNRPTPTTGL